MAVEHSNIWITMHKICKICHIELTENNWVRVSENCIRSRCRKCRSKQVMEYDKANRDKKNYRINLWARKIGRVKQYPCETCKTMCYKKYARAFCSIKCRFMAHVKVTDTCWLWTGAKNRRGYGKSNVGSKGTSAHRASFEIFNGQIPESLFICHSCDVKLCVNPAHLWAGNHIENMMDMVEKGRQASKLTPLQVLKIRELVEKFGVSNKKICKQYGLTPGGISNIIARRNWKHI